MIMEEPVIITDNNIPKLIGVYGTLRKGFGNHPLMGLSAGESRFIGSGRTVEKYVLQQQGIPFVSKKKMDVEGFTGSNVLIEVYEVNNADRLRRIDSLEGHPRFYYRSPVKVDLGEEGIVEVEVYLCDRGGGPENLSGDYAEMYGRT